MKQFSTGTGVAVLGVCILAATVVATHRGSGEAFAQGTGGDRRIVSAGVFQSGGTLGQGYQNTYAGVYAYRIWSDNAVDLRCVGMISLSGWAGSAQSNLFPLVPQNSPYDFTDWKTVDNGTSGFRPLTDVDMSGETDAGDISQVLLDFNTRSNDLPPPPIDCIINAPR